MAAWELPFAAIVAVCGASLAWSGGRELRGREIAGALLNSGYCGSCGYPLAGLLPGQDGCVTCPECRAAWRPGPRF